MDLAGGAIGEAALAGTGDAGGQFVAAALGQRQIGVEQFRYALFQFHVVVSCRQGARILLQVTVLHGSGAAW